MFWTLERLSEYGLQPPSARVPMPEGPQDVASVIERALRERPRSVALVGRHDRLTFEEMDARVRAAGQFLRELGVGEGDRVGACASNHVDIVIAFLAVQRLGAMWVSINRNYAPPEKRFLLEDSGACVFLGDDRAVDEIEGQAERPPALRHVIRMEPGDAASDWRQGVEARLGNSPAFPQIDPWAPAAIAYTSGTTGFPKGVVHSQHNMALAAWVANMLSERMDADVVRATALPMTILNLMILGPVAAFGTGARHICIDRIDAEGVAEWVEREQVNTLSLVPTVVQDMLTLPAISPNALRSITRLVAGGAVVPQSLPGLYEARFGHQLRVGYGLTECPTGVSGSGERTPAVQGAIGRPLFHLEVAIQDEAGRPVPNGEAGEICFRATKGGPWADVYAGPLGYWNRGDATAHLLRGGWVHTGDIGSYDADGELYIHDRRNDLIIRGGSNIYPAEVERILREDTRVRDCAVVGKSDPRLGEVVVAFIEPFEANGNEGLVADLEAYCQGRIAKYKIPVHWEVVPGMPRNAMGKILKGELKKRFGTAVEPAATV
jgi:acyl-CoA synthetase (AMP-forming)/AMP-acid ligase II